MYVLEQDVIIAPDAVMKADELEHEEEEEDKVVDNNNILDSDFKLNVMKRINDNIHPSQLSQGEGHEQEQGNFSERSRGHREDQDNTNSKSWRKGMRLRPLRMGDGRKGYSRDNIQYQVIEILSINITVGNVFHFIPCQVFIYTYCTVYLL